MAASVAALYALLLQGLAAARAAALTPTPPTPPQPRLCLRVSHTRPLFVNVCAWPAVPPPGPALAGPLRDVQAEGGLYSVIDVAFNPDVLQGVEKSQEKMDHLIHQTLQFLEERHNLVLPRSYTIEPFPPKGSLGMMEQRPGGAPEPPEPQPSHGTTGATEGPEGGRRDPGGTEAKGVLIEEISSTELPRKPSSPAYKMVTVWDANREWLKIMLRIELPHVSSASECDLSVSKDDIIIEVPEKYKLQLDLPERVDEETTTAVFNKTKRVLFISAPLAKPDSHSAQLLVPD